jgi:hypothetical protein
VIRLGWKYRSCGMVLRTLRTRLFRVSDRDVGRISITTTSTGTRARVPSPPSCRPVLTSSNLEPAGASSSGGSRALVSKASAVAVHLLGEPFGRY